jgi:hypothetical protein
MYEHTGDSDERNKELEVARHSTYLHDGYSLHHEFYLFPAVKVALILVNTVQLFLSNN